jgi:hypothetical protein
MISTLKDRGYEIPTYTGLMPKLKELVPSTFSVNQFTRRPVDIH